jgi:hypothetical protein
VGARFSATVQTGLLYNEYRVFPGGKVRPGRDTDPSPPSSAEVKNRAIPVLSLRAFVAYEGVKRIKKKGGGMLVWEGKLRGTSIFGCLFLDIFISLCCFRLLLLV